tara:strand:+ start:136 stop:339 length:204 start_codon:yes stop_codon:yes gene_type:complete
LVERRWRNWYGVSIREKWAIFGDQLVIIQKIKKELEDRVGKIVIIFEVVSKISKQLNGKFKTVISNL